MRLNWFSKPSKNRDAGLITGLIARVAPSWRWSPLRPFVQGVSLAAFLFLFLYVCFPTGEVPPPSDTAASDGVASDGASADAWPSHYSDELSRKEFVPAAFFLGD